ncbi:uncharacterized protein LOC124406805 [Diprion similis]|uniref:uncharacterized protein LOC124406805 n=1 Tax=Diprion similis TaxID=362088 RepID=UPI001EF913CA|nr:uncharacterized protein LOC124406805 [Diprion similis]
MVVWVTRGARTVHETVVSLVAVDEDMKSFKFSRKSECLGGQQPWLLGLQVFVSTTMIIFTIILTFSTRQTTPPGVLTAWIVYAMKIIVSRIQLVIADIILSCIIRQIRIRFQRINTALYQMGNIFDPSVLIPSRVPLTRGRGREIIGIMNRLRLMKSQVEKILGDVNILWQMHKSSCDIATELNCAFWPYLVCTLLVTLPLCMQHAFVLAVTKFTQYENSMNRYIIIAFHFSALVQIIVKSWMLVLSCDDLAAEANKFGIMLHQIDISDAGFNRQLRELSVKQSQNKFTMSAGGLFPINISFITYIFCPVMAYTVFVYQLNN